MTPLETIIGQVTTSFTDLSVDVLTLVVPAALGVLTLFFGVKLAVRWMRKFAK